MAMTTKKMMDAYNERQKKQVSKSENKTKTGNKDMKGGNRDPQSIPGKNKALMSKIAGGSKGTFNIPKSGPKTIPEKNKTKMSEIAGNSPMGKGGQGSTMAKKAAPKKKNPIVTEKMLKDSGYTNLRDYMNAKAGKTRKDGKTASRTAAAKKRDMMGEFKAGGKVKKMMGGGMTKGKMMKYRGGGMVSKSRPTKYI
jgi:hypothetical protein